MRRRLQNLFPRFTATALLVTLIALHQTARAQSAPATQTFALTDTTGLIAKNVDVKAVEYKGRKAVLVTPAANQRDGFALLPGTDFQDGTIEADVALKITTPPGVRMPGFFGIAFRARPDASHYELFYLRPGNSHAQDQAMRNHSVQYVSIPGFDWDTLRRQWPYVYETYAPQQLETWMKVKIEVKGRVAKLYLNDSEEPSLIVNGLKGEDLHGGVALWGYPGEEAYFSNVRITNVAPDPIKNGSDAAGTWQLRFAGDAGGLQGSLKLARDGSKLSGTWSANYAKSAESPVQGTWRDGYIDLTFPTAWPQGPNKPPSQVTAHMAGWIDGDSAQGRMLVEGESDGPWTATKGDNAFLGEWKLNTAKSKLTDVMKVESVGGNKYAFNFGGGSETVAVDGTDQPGNGGSMLSVAVEGPNSWKVVRKKDGRMLLTANWTLSGDGKSLTDDYTAINPNGSTNNLKYVYNRKGNGSGFSGEWVSVTETMSSPLVVQIEPNGDDGLSFVFPAQGSVQNYQLDGKDHPNLGANAASGSTFSLRRVNEHALELTYKFDSKVLFTQQMELSPDLNTLTFTRLIVGETEPAIQVFDRQ